MFMIWYTYLAAASWIQDEKACSHAFIFSEDKASKSKVLTPTHMYTEYFKRLILDLEKREREKERERYGVTQVY